MFYPLEAFKKAAERIAPFTVQTPVRQWEYLRRTIKFEAPIYLKLETMQNTGAFKARGAANKIGSLCEGGKKPTSVLAASAGNHAQAVAFVAGRLGIPATIVMPEGAPLVKSAATRDYGAEVVLHGNVYDDAFARAQEILKSQPGAVYVHAYEDPEIIQGQGTIGLEIHEQLKQLGVGGPLQVVVPIGGGGLISGTAMSLKALNSKVKVFGVVCEAAPGMAESFRTGQLVNTPPGTRSRTLGEGLAVKKVSALTFGMIKELVEEIAIVGDDDMASAIFALMERGKLVTEGSGAAGVAAMLSHKFTKLDPSVPTVIILCGGNIDMNTMSNILERAFARDGRWLHLRVTVEDRPGELAKLTQLIGEARANVLEVSHDRTSRNCPVGQTMIRFHLETAGHAHVASVIEKLKSRGLKVEVIDQ